jgi:hypothetical protein
MSSGIQLMMSNSQAILDNSVLDPQEAALAERFVRWLDSGIRPQQLFHAEVFADISLPHWRVQGTNPEELYAIREDDHSGQSHIRVEYLDWTSRGFLLQFEERWTAGGLAWYARELIHAIVEGGLITEMSVYCTGDWDQATQRRHAAEVRLTRP